ncbi:MAG: glycosyltransferase family 2 protein, partial [Peptococcaceae bacterium]|nr:glycosyltransferase family 2 protein [Peptococcaceae bacterium]
MASLIYGVNLTIGIVFFIMYFYQIIYLIVGLIDKQKKGKTYNPKKLHKIAVLISARNESKVIGELCKSILQQDYPKDKLHIFVVADNCTDNTADICRDLGCTVFERFNKQYIGKGYAMNFAFEKIFADPANDYDAFLVLDADNLLTKNYVSEMNKVFDQGYRVITSYRNSKNYAQNWISSGYGLWFLREAEYLNRPRYVLHNSCAISGTGFMVAADLIKERGGWNYHLLTEDIEFTAATIVTGEKIGYAGGAMLYDEQPITFKQSWNQRMRWAKGFYQVLGKHGFDLAKSIFRFDRASFSAFDMLMN